SLDGHGFNAVHLEPKNLKLHKPDLDRETCPLGLLAGLPLWPAGQGPEAALGSAAGPEHIFERWPLGQRKKRC
ncbi:MAG: hypothetical protein DRI01_10645, partial [Chloroflexi bacterium]